MTVLVSYYVSFGKGDCSDAFEWEVELTPEEEIVSAIRSVTLDELKKTSVEILNTDRISFCSVGRVKAKSEYEKLLRK